MNEAASPERLRGLAGLFSGLSLKLLILTIGFVMLAEVLIFVPSIARFREDFLKERLATGHLAILSLEATTDNMVSPELEAELLTHAEAYVVALRQPGRGKLGLMRVLPGPIDASYDLNRAGPWMLIADAFRTLASPPGRILRVIGDSPKMPDAEIEVVIDETPLREAMYAFAWRILALSLLISVITAALVYASLHWLLVRPMRRITDSMVAFAADPESPAARVAASGRRDEVGTAERELGRMQEQLLQALAQQARLAALGTAVTKINHDLRNILGTALLLSDRLVASGDPEVRRVTPRLMQEIERASGLCSRTLDYTRDGAPPLSPTHFALAPLVEEVAASLEPLSGELEEGWLETRGLAAIELKADRDQLFRVFANLIGNALQAGATTVRLEGRRRGREAVVELTDNGPGLPPRAREQLFVPFGGRARSGGTGLGLPIARELMRAHDGELELVSSGAQGTRFRLTFSAACVAEKGALRAAQ